MRKTTERPEGLTAGVNLLVGTEVESIFGNVDRLLKDSAAYVRMASIKNPYGDGTAGVRIAAILRNDLTR